MLYHFFPLSSQHFTFIFLFLPKSVVAGLKRYLTFIYKFYLLIQAKKVYTQEHFLYTNTKKMLEKNISQTKVPSSMYQIKYTLIHVSMMKHNFSVYMSFVFFQHTQKIEIRDHEIEIIYMYY